MKMHKMKMQTMNMCTMKMTVCNENVHDGKADNENVHNEKLHRVDFIPRIILVFCKILDPFAKFWIHVQNFGYIFMPRARTNWLFRYISLFLPCTFFCVHFFFVSVHFLVCRACSFVIIYTSEEGVGRGTAAERRV